MYSACALVNCFNPRTYIRYDREIDIRKVTNYLFQSTYLYKVRLIPVVIVFVGLGFNPRTYIRYDLKFHPFEHGYKQFQSTYLYKVRPSLNTKKTLKFQFQSTYLYKVRHVRKTNRPFFGSFNPRTYIRYDTSSTPVEDEGNVSIHVPI